MEFKCLVTAALSMCDESIRVNIEGDDSFVRFKERVLEALDYADYRKNIQMLRLLEDSISLTEVLNEEELRSTYHAAKLLFPQAFLKDKPSLTSGVKFEFAKITAAGESVTIQLHDIESYDSLNTAIKHVYELLDQRTWKSNKRQLEHIDYLKELPYETRLKVGMIMDVLYGRVPGGLEEVSSRLAQGEAQETLDRLREEVLAQREGQENSSVDLKVSPEENS